MATICCIRGRLTMEAVAAFCHFSVRQNSRRKISINKGLSTYRCLAILTVSSPRDRRFDTCLCRRRKIQILTQLQL